MTEPLRYAVLLSAPEHFRPPELAKALAAFRKVPAFDLAAAARGCWGIVEEGLEEGGARALAEALTKAGLPSLALPQNLIEDPPRPEPLSRAVLSAEGFLPEPAPAPPGAPAPALVPWAKVSLVLAAAFTVTEQKTVKVEEGPDLARRAVGLGITMVTGLPMGFGGKKKEVEKTVKTSDLVFALDLVLREPSRRLRVSAHDFDYSGLGDRKGFDAAGNFKTLVGEFAKRAPAARQGRGTRVLLEGKPVREAGYESLASLDRECRWLLTLEALKGSHQ